MELPPRRGVLVGLAALVPGVLFAVERADPTVVIALVNVVLIVGSLYVAFSPVGDGHHGGNGHGAGG